MSEILTTVEKHEKEFGVGNFFLICADYHGKYEDDYCYFTYFDNLTGQILDDYWTTAAACPNYSRYECMTVKEAQEKGLLNMELWNNYKIEGFRKSLYNEDSSVSYVFKPHHHSIVEVKKGRKWKGIGILVDVVEKVYAWGPSYGRGYNQSVTETAVIYDFNDCCLHECNVNFVEIVNAKEILAEYNRWANEWIDRAAKETKNNWETMKTSYNWSFDKFMEERFQKLGINVENAFYPEQVERERQAAEKKAKTMSDIIAWVKENTDKTSIEDIMGLAHGIYRKRYA